MVFKARIMPLVEEIEIIVQQHPEIKGNGGPLAKTAVAKRFADMNYLFAACSKLEHAWNFPGK
jgi:hypothetical protein